MRTKLTADHVIGFDGRDHIILEKGEVVFEANTIIFTGHGFTGQVDRSIDYGHAVIGPGFIDLDALGDLDTSVLGFDNGPGTGIGRVWSEHYLRQGPVEAYTAEEGLFKYRYAFTQLIRNGITTAMPITSMLYRAWAETYGEFEAVAAIAGELGLRAYLGPGYMSGVTYLRDGKLARHYDEDKGLAGLAEALRFIGDHDGRDNGRIRGCLCRIVSRRKPRRYSGKPLLPRPILMFRCGCIAVSRSMSLKPSKPCMARHPIAGSTNWD